jgi:outer membrane protein assembly complex protein YaeT
MLPLVLLALFMVPLSAQENRFEGLPVKAIRFEPQQPFLDPRDLAEKLHLELGRPLKMSDVRATVESLFASGSFEDIAVDAQLNGEGVDLTFQVSPARFVRNVSVTGVEEPPSPGQLVNVTKLQLGQQYVESQIRQSVEGLLESLRANGFYLAKVVPEAVEQPHQQIDITFRVDTGERAAYLRPEVRGNPNKAVDDIVGATRWKRWFGIGPWRRVTDARTQQGLDRVRRSYQKKDFLMARVSLDRMEYVPDGNRAQPILTVDSGPRVTIRTRGAKISRGTLRQLVPVFQELTVDKDLLVEGKREITEYLQARGYFEAEVDFDHSRENGSDVIEYAIFPGARHKLVHVGIDGNRYFSDDTLRERMFTTPATLLRFRRGRFSQDFLRRDVNAIRALYETNGFREVVVTTRVEDDHQGRENEVAAYFDIKEGPQWFVSSLDIEGVDQATGDDLRSMLLSFEGQPFSELNVAGDQDTILGYFFNNGYPQARFEAQVTPADKPAHMAIKYTVDPGERQFVRDVLISGLNATREQIVRSRIQNLQPGDPLAQSSMIESQRRLYDLGIFARVDTAIHNQDGDTDHKFVLYRFEEASRYSLTGGIGAQIGRIGRGEPSLDTPAGSPGFSPRVSLGISRSNFFGVGHTATIQTQWSNIRRRGLLTYLAPQFKGDDRLNLTLTGLYDDSRDVQTFNSRRAEAWVQLAQRLSKANVMQYRVSWRRVTISDIVITPSLVPLFSQPIQLATVSGTFIQDRRDDATNATRGVYNTIDAALAGNFWSSPKNSFTRVLARNATYHRIAPELILARSLSFGVETTLRPYVEPILPDGFGEPRPGDVPLPERFFAGGATSHRGFPEYQAGPRDLLTGFPIGGKALLINNLELRFPLLGDNVGGVMFHDAGNVYSSLSDVSFRVLQRDLRDFNYMVHAVGFGVRYRTPIGPVRVDLAYSVNSPRFMGLKGTREQLLDPNLAGVEFVEQRISRFQFHFSLGQLF